jgi:hypothetical protein
MEPFVTLEWDGRWTTQPVWTENGKNFFLTKHRTITAWPSILVAIAIKLPGIKWRVDN